MTSGPPDVADLSRDGLSDSAVRARVARGATNDVPVVPTRSVRQIVRANVLTRFNAILGALLLVILVVGDLRDALFGVILVANSAIGIWQELRAKRTLDRLVVVTAPAVRVIRAGTVREVGASDIVIDDVIELRPGDQVVVDGTVLTSDGLELDESLLTGESDPVAKAAGDDALSGSFAAAGSGRYKATRVGGDAYARDIAARARSFTLFDSQLRHDIDTFLRLATWALLPTAAILIVSQLRTQATVEQAVAASVGGVVAMVPEGLVLLTSTAFAVAVVRLARHRTLVQELPAVEGLARADVLCLDKTGTLTRGAIAFTDLELVDVPGDVESAIGAVAAADPNPNATLRAVATHFHAPDGWVATGVVPFSSARKYMAAAFEHHGVWVLGAPEVLFAVIDADPSIEARVAALAEDGARVLLIASADGAEALSELPRDLRPRALVVLSDELRPDAAAVLRTFHRDGVVIKVISGDDPRTVGAIARRAGIVDVRVVDARALPDEGPQLRAAVESGTVFGRVRPQQKEAMVAALQSAGHVVAMTGDGVNDVLALKRADLGVAMGSGSPATCAVAQLVLLDDEFAALPRALGEGRRVIGNVDRVARLFVTKSVYSLLLALAVGVAVLPFPFLPRHLSLIGALTIGIPGVFLAMAPNTRRARPGMVGDVLRFAVPAGSVAAAATFAGYYVTRLLPDVNLDEARTTATLVLLSVGLLVLARLARPLTTARRMLIGAMTVAMVLATVVPGLRAFFALDPPPPIVVLAAIGVVAMSERLLHLGDSIALRRRPPADDAHPPRGDVRPPAPEGAGL
ncbi:MAG TPA: HAD-IC family P-type ATPase [Euzebyales bacterium]